MESSGRGEDVGVVVSRSGLTLIPVYTKTGQSGDRATAQSRLPYMVKWAGLDGGRSSLEREAFDGMSDAQ